MLTASNQPRVKRGTINSNGSSSPTFGKLLSKGSDLTRRKPTTLDRSGPKLVETSPMLVETSTKLAGTGPLWSNHDQMRCNSDEHRGIWSKSAKVCRNRLNLVETDQTRPNMAQIWPKSGQPNLFSQAHVRSTPANFGRNQPELRTNLVETSQLRPKSARAWLKSAQNSPTPAKFGRAQRNVGRNLHKFDRKQPKLAECGCKVWSTETQIG